MLNWLKTQAHEGVLLVGFCELNNWQDLESLSELPKNRPKIHYRAANAGFSFSHVMVNAQVNSIVYVNMISYSVVSVLLRVLI